MTGGDENEPSHYYSGSGYAVAGESKQTYSRGGRGSYNHYNNNNNGGVRGGGVRPPFYNNRGSGGKCRL